MKDTAPAMLRILTSKAREKLSEIITKVQDPRAFCVLTRHGKAVAAIVSMSELKRIWNAHDVEDMTRKTGRMRPSGFYYGPSGEARTFREAAEEIQKIQLDRRSEREMLEWGGLEPIEGGELRVEVEAGLVETEQPGWWRRVWGRFRKG